MMSACFSDVSGMYSKIYSRNGLNSQFELDFSAFLPQIVFSKFGSAFEFEDPIFENYLCME